MIIASMDAHYQCTAAVRIWRKMRATLATELARCWCDQKAARRALPMIPKPTVSDTSQRVGGHHAGKRKKTEMV